MRQIISLSALAVYLSSSLGFALGSASQGIYSSKTIHATFGLESGYRWDVLRHHGPGDINYMGTLFPGSVNNKLTSAFAENTLKGRLFFSHWAYIRAEGAFGCSVNATHIHQSQAWTHASRFSFYMPLSAYTTDVKASLGLQLFWTPKIVSTIEGGWGHHRLWHSAWIDTRFSGPFVAIGSRYYLGSWTCEWNFSYSFLGLSREELTPVYTATSSNYPTSNTIKRTHSHGAGTDFTVSYAASDNMGISLVYVYRDARTPRHVFTAWNDTNILGSWNEMTQLRTNALRLGIDYSF